MLTGAVHAINTLQSNCSYLICTTPVRPQNASEISLVVDNEASATRSELREVGSAKMSRPDQQASSATHAEP